MSGMMILPTGPKTAAIALICEAPNHDESLAGTLFLGPAGEKLDSLLASVGLCRDQIYITSVLKETPLGTDPSTYVKQGLLGPEPTEEFNRQQTLLLEELTGIEAKVLIPLGNTALLALTGQWGINQRRGSLWPSHCGTKTVLPTFHPATALRNRNPINHFIIQMDLMKAKSLAEGTLAPPTEPLLHLDPPFEQVLDFLGRCLRAERVGFDIESSTQRVKGSRYTREMTMFSIALPGESMAVPISLPNSLDQRWTPIEEDAILCALFEVLEAPSVLKIGQNLSYDASVLYHRYGTLIWPFEDTMMGARTVCPDLDANLGFLCSIHTLQPYYKDLAHGGTWQDFLRYSALDSAVVLDIWPRVERDLQQQGNLSVYQRAKQAFRPALFIQEHGLLMDKAAQREKAREVEKEMASLQAQVDAEYLQYKQQDPVWKETVEKLEAEISLAQSKVEESTAALKTKYETIQEALVKATQDGKATTTLQQRLLKAEAAWHKAGERIAKTKGKEEKLAALRTLNVQSPPQLTKFFYGKRPAGLGHPPLLNDGSPSADEKARKRLIAKGFSIVKTIDDLVQLSNDLGKYWTATSDPDNRARCSIDVTGTDSLRWASKISMFSTGYQFFNTPKRFRPLQIADAKRPFLQMDLAQAENRIVAVLANDARMMDAFDRELDVHRLTAGLMFGKHPDTISDEPGSSSLGDGLHSERDWGKKANHAFNYGLGPSGAVEKLEVPAKDAKFLYEAYHRAYPGVRGTFWAGVKEQVYRTRYLENLVGHRRLYLTPLTGDNERAAYSFIPQSTVPSILRDWVMVPTYEEGLPPISLVNHVYDSLEYQYDLRAEGIRGMAEFVLDLRSKADKPLSYKGRSFRIPADFKAGWSLGRMTGLKGTILPDLIEELTTILYPEGVS
jgi:uracil-DNA glycosylase family 4